MNIVVRPMKSNEARAFLETHRASVRGVASADYPSEVIDAWAPPVTDEAVAAFLGNPDDEVCVVAELDGEFVGIGSVVPRLKQLRACYVAPKGIRKGVGTRIVRELERIARESGVRRLESVSTVTAEPFYRNLGYVMGRRIRHVTSTGVAMDAIEMSRELSGREGDVTQ